jgi:hypothetical protein
MLATARTRSLKLAVCRLSLTGERTGANPSARRTLPYRRRGSTPGSRKDRPSPSHPRYDRGTSRWRGARRPASPSPAREPAGHADVPLRRQHRSRRRVGGVRDRLPRVRRTRHRRVRVRPRRRSRDLRPPDAPQPLRTHADRHPSPRVQVSLRLVPRRNSALCLPGSLDGQPRSSAHPLGSASGHVTTARRSIRSCASTTRS